MSENPENPDDILEFETELQKKRKEISEALANHLGKKRSEINAKDQKISPAQKAANTKKSNKLRNLQDELSDLEYKKNISEGHLRKTQDDLDDILKELDEDDKIKFVDSGYIKRSLEKENKFFKFLQNNSHSFLRNSIKEIITEDYHLDLDDYDTAFKKQAEERLELETDRILERIELIKIDSDIAEKKKEIKRFGGEIDKPISAKERKRNNQLGIILTTEGKIKSALKNFLKGIPNWYEERISEQTRKNFEFRNVKKPGFDEQVKNQKLEIIDDFSTNELQFIFGKDGVNDDFSQAVFGTKSDTIFGKIKHIKDCRNILGHGKKDGKPISGIDEEDLENYCRQINESVDEYLKK